MIGMTNVASKDYNYSTHAFIIVACDGSVLASARCYKGDFNFVYPGYHNWFAFSVPENGTYTVEINRDGDIRRKTVTISSYGQREVLRFFYTGILYDAGYENTQVTGGWKAEGFLYTTDSGFEYQKHAPTLTKNTSNMVMSYPGFTDSYSCGRIVTTNKIDLSGYSTLKVTTSNIVSSTNSAIYLTANNSTTGGTTNRTLMVSEGGKYTTSHTFSYSISSLTSSYYVYIFIRHWASTANTASATITKIWVE